LDESSAVLIPEWILAESKKYGYDPLFLTALIITESSFYNRARSNRNAHGLMQLKPATAVMLASEIRLQWKGTRTLYDPKKNIALGAYYLNKLVDRFGDLTLALEAYNQGPSRLSRFLRKGYLPQRYSKKVLKNYRRIRFQPI
jgi:soluble lytic murein transglycosylase